MGRNCPAMVPVKTPPPEWGVIENGGACRQVRTRALRSGVHNQGTEHSTYAQTTTLPCQLVPGYCVSRSSIPAVTRMFPDHANHNRTFQTQHYILRRMKPCAVMQGLAHWLSQESAPMLL